MQKVPCLLLAPFFLMFLVSKGKRGAHNLLQLGRSHWLHSLFIYLFISNKTFFYYYYFFPLGRMTVEVKEQLIAVLEE